MFSESISMNLYDFDTFGRYDIGIYGKGHCDLIEVSGLTKYYGDHAALEDLDFILKEGSVTGFLGPNGAGKSTALNMITGYLSPTSGSIRVGEHNLYEEPEEAKRLIGYLPEVPPVYPELTVRENLEFAAGLRKISGKEMKDEIRRVSEELGLSEVENRLGRNLSKGFRQRVGFAMALIGDPKILILDEPTAGLDPKQVIEIRDLIRKLKKDHTILLSSHILSEIAEVCDEILILSEGMKAAQGSLEELREKTGRESLEEIFLELTADDEHSAAAGEEKK